MKKILSLFLAVILLFLLASCGNEVATSTPPSVAPSVAPATSTTPEETDEPETNGLPLVTEPVSFEYWIPMNAAAAPYMADLNDGNIFFAEMEKRTGVHMNFVQEASMNAREKLNLMVASDIFSDIIANMGLYYSGGLDKAITDSFAIDLTGLLAEFAPNYSAIVEGDATIKRAVYTNGGTQPTICQLRDRKQTQFTGMMLREDWLDELGMSVPSTFDEWHDTLSAFAAFTGGAGPLFLPKNAAYNGNLFAGALGIAVGTNSGVNAFCLDTNNKVMFGPAQPAYREYVQLLTTWYNEGLVDADFMSRSETTEPNTVMLSNNQIGAYCGLFMQGGDFYVRSGIIEDENFSLVLAPIPVKNKGDEPRVGMYNARCTSNTVGNSITTACKDPALAVKWHDYLYSDEGALLANYGIEGVTFDFNAEGQPRAYDLIVNNPDGLAASTAQYRYLFQNGGHLFLQDREDGVLVGNAAEYVTLWRHDFVGNLPNFQLESDASARRTTLINDINTYVDEWTVGVISGLKSIDSFDDYVSQLYAMGVQETIDLTQAGWEVYSSR